MLYPGERERFGVEAIGFIVGESDSMGGVVGVGESVASYIKQKVPVSMC